MTHDKNLRVHATNVATALDVGEFRLLDKLNETDLGVIRFATDSGKERHKADEMVFVLSGAVDLYLDDCLEPTRLDQGDFAVIPAGRWHRQVPKPEVSLLFATASSTTDYEKDRS